MAEEKKSESFTDIVSDAISLAEKEQATSAAEESANKSMSWMQVMSAIDDDLSGAFGGVRDSERAAMNARGYQSENVSELLKMKQQKSGDLEPLF